MSETTITREQFEAEYAAGCGKTIDELRRRGRFSVPCDCGDPSCRGWQMLTPGCPACDDHGEAASYEVVAVPPGECRILTAAQTQFVEGSIVRRLVEEAYREGYAQGIHDVHVTDNNPDYAWTWAEAKRDLDALLATAPGADSSAATALRD